MSLTRTLVKQIREKSITANDRQQAALLVMDAMASAHAGSATVIGQKFRLWAERHGRSVSDEVFLNACLTHITETDDLHRESVTHPGCAVVPVVLALSAQKTVSSQQFLDAVIRGFEAVCRVGMSVGPKHYKVWHNTATCGPFGSAMAAAELLELSEDETVWALGNAGTQSGGLWEFLSDGAMSKHVHAGRAAQAGLLAAEMAACGISGAEHILEGEKGFYRGLCEDPDPSQVEIPADSLWQVHRTSIKPWPSCRHTHPAIDAAIELGNTLNNRGIKANDGIARVVVETYQAALDLCDRDKPVNEYQAKFSLQHCVSSALADGEVGLSSFDESKREQHADLRKRVAVAVAEPAKSSYPDSWGARIVVETLSGEQVEVSRKDCLGDPELPLDARAMQDKAGSLMKFAGMDGAQADDLCHSILDLPQRPGEPLPEALRFQVNQERG